MNKKKAVIAFAVTVVLLANFLVWIRPAGAWTFLLKGEAKCENYEWKVTWSVNNQENEALHILSSTRPVVPVGTDVPAGTVGEFTEVVTTDVSLTLEGNFPSDQTVRSRSADVKLVGECKKPEKPPVVVPPEVHQLPNTSTKG